MALKDTVILHFETTDGRKIIVKARLDQVRLDWRGHAPVSIKETTQHNG